MGIETQEKGIGKECKDYMVKDLQVKFLKDKNIFITSYIGLSAEDLNQLRLMLRKISSQYLVVKNSITKRALRESEMDELAEFIKGSVGLAFGGEEPISAIKALVNFAKSHEKLDIRTGCLNGEILDKGRITELSALPSRKELLFKLTCLMNSPITGFVNVLAGTLRSFVYVIQAYKEKINEAQTSGANDPSTGSGLSRATL